MGDTSTNYSRQKNFKLNNKIADLVFDGELEWLFDAIDRRVLPAVTIGGLLLQSLNVVVLLSKQLRNNAIRFLAAMSFVDVLFLLVQLPFLPMPFIAYDKENASPMSVAYYEFVHRFYQRFVLYPMSRVCLETNTWLAVFVSCERYLALRSANSSWACASRYSATSRKLSFPAICAAFILAVALNVNTFFVKAKSTNANSSADSGEPNGSGDDAVEGNGAVIRFALTYLLPLVLLLAFNTALAYLLVKYCRQQLRMRSVKGLHLENGGRKSNWQFGCWRHCGANRKGDSQQIVNSGESLRVHGHSRNTLSTAVMVLAAMLVHLAFDAPGTALTVLVFFKGQAVVQANSWLVLASHASNVLVLVHCSIDWYAMPS